MTIYDLMKVTEIYTAILIFKNKTHESIFSGTINTLYEACYRDLKEKQVQFLKVLDSTLIVYI